MGLERWRREMLLRSAEGCEVAVLDGRPVEYRDSGGPGPVVLHFSMGPASAHKLLPEIPAAGFRLITMGRPGCMGTPITSGRDYADQVALGAALLGHLAIERAAVIGISQSGPFPLLFGLRYPERVTCLVVYSGITRPWSHEDYWTSLLGKLLLTDRAMWLVWNAVSVFGWGFLINGWCKAFGVDAAYVKATPKMIERFRTFIDVGLPPSAVADSIENDFEQARSLPRIPVEDLSCPVLVLHGTKDEVVPVEHGRFVAERAARAESCFFEGGSHVLMLDEEFHEEAERALLGFLRRHAGAP